MKTALRKNAIINGRYSVLEVINTNINGQIEYCCVDAQADKQVLIKEFYPDYAVRSESNELHYNNLHEIDIKKFRDRYDFAKKFQSLPTVIPVLDVFEANNTCYAVCEHVEGTTLDKLIENNSAFTFSSIQKTLINFLKTNESLLKFGMCHANFAPENILITSDGCVKLCEFYPESAKTAEKAAVKSLAALGYFMLCGVRLDAKKKSAAPSVTGNMLLLSKYVTHVYYNNPDVNTAQFLEVAKNKFDVKVPGKFATWFGDKKNKKLVIRLSVIFAIALVLISGVVCGLVFEDKIRNDLDTDLAIEYAVVTDANAEQTYQKLEFKESTAFGQIQFPNTQMEKRQFEGIDSNVTHIYFKVKAIDEDTTIAVKNNGEEVKSEDGIYKVPLGDGLAEVEIISTHKMPIISFWSKTSTYPVKFTKNTFAKLTGLTYTVDGTDIDIGFDPSTVEYSVGTVYVGQTAVVTPIYDAEKYKVEITDGGKVPTSQPEVVMVEIKVSGANAEDKTITENTYTIVVDVKEVPKEETEEEKTVEKSISNTKKDNIGPKPTGETTYTVPPGLDEETVSSDGSKVADSVVISKLGLGDLSKNVNIYIKWAEDEANAGKVISTSHSAGTKMKKGEKLTVTVGYKPEPETIRVPKLGGEKYNGDYAAKKIKELEDFGIKVHIVDKEYKSLESSEDVDTIERTFPGEGSEIEKGSDLTVYVKKLDQ